MKVTKAAAKSVKSASNIPVKCKVLHRTIALVLEDVARIIDTIPLGHPDRDAESALLLFASFTGARPITATNIKLSDIMKFYYENHEYHIIVNASTAKGKRKLSNPKHLSGQITKGETLDNFMYYLRRHILSKYNLDLLHFNDWKLKDKQQCLRIWPYAADDCRTRLQRRAVWAGYHEKVINFRSLRFGFMSNALINKWKNGTDNMSDVILQAALVGNWLPYGKSQLGYIHSTMQELIIANKLCRGSSSQSCIDVGSASRSFYKYPKCNPHPPININYRGMQQQILDSIPLPPTVSTLSRRRQLDYRMAAYDRGLVGYARKHQPTICSRACYVYRSIIKSIRRYLINKLKDDKTYEQNIATIKPLIITRMTESLKKRPLRFKM